jgi:L-fuconolactonase
MTANKPELYRDLSRQLSALLAGEADLIANAANTAALIYHGLPDLNWAGFYFRRGPELVLGPFQGKPACVRIPIGEGVCGTAAARAATVLVRDVHEFPGHIACDPDSRSELVVPLVNAGGVLGVFDLDSPVLARFDEIDREGCERLVGLFVEHLRRFPDGGGQPVPSAATQTAISSHLPVRQDWLDQRREEIIEPDLAIVDPHHHLVDRPETGRYLLPELLADLGSGHNITATVYLEWLSMYRATGPAELRPVGEIEFANGVAAMAASGTYGKPRVCAGIVGYADLMLGASVEKVLEAMIAAGGGRFRGIRFISATHPDQAAWGSLVNRPAGLLMDERVREGFARLAPLGLSFDAWMYHTQLGELVDLARAFPETEIVLDHVGGPIGLGRYAGKRDEVFAEWSARICELAGCSNVHIKLGGLGMRMFGFNVHTGELPPSSEELAAAWRPYIETCITAFGPERAMFESNFPVDKGSCGYAALWNAFKRIAAGCSTAEKAALFAATAAKFYRLGS